MHIAPNYSWPCMDDLLVIDGDLAPTCDVMPDAKNRILLNVLLQMRLALQEHLAYKSIEQCDLAVIETELRDCIVSSMGVLALWRLSVSMNANVRLLAVSFVCNTVAGIMRYDGPVMAQTSFARFQ